MSFRKNRSEKKDKKKNLNLNSNSKKIDQSLNYNGMDTNSNSPPLKIFGEANILSTINIVENETANVTINKIINYTFLESQEKLIYEGENITIHFTGIGNEENWNTTLLSINNSFYLKIRCLDGRINSLESFTKEKCFWEADEEDIKTI